MCIWTDFVKFTCEKNFKMCICLCKVCPEVTLCGWQDIKIQLLTNSIVCQISTLEDEKRDLERQVNELKAKCEQIEKRAAEQRQVEEKKHTEEIQFLKRTNTQLKVPSS